MSGAGLQPGKKGTETTISRTGNGWLADLLPFLLTLTTTVSSEMCENIKYSIQRTFDFELLTCKYKLWKQSLSALFRICWIWILHFHIGSGLSSYVACFLVLSLLLNAESLTPPHTPRWSVCWHCRQPFAPPNQPTPPSQSQHHQSFHREQIICICADICTFPDLHYRHEQTSAPFDECPFEVKKGLKGLFLH